jgi:hypothetical protein
MALSVIEYNIELQVDRWILNSEGFGRKMLRCSQGTIPAFIWRDWRKAVEPSSLEFTEFLEWQSDAVNVELIRFAVISFVMVQIVDFSDVTPCSLVVGHLHCRRTCCLWLEWMGRLQRGDLWDPWVAERSRAWFGPVAMVNGNCVTTVCKKLL